MKVIGFKEKDYSPTYICEVSHRELKELTNKYYGEGELKHLKVGDEMDLGKGYNFRDDIKSACAGIVQGAEKFERALASIRAFSVMVTKLPQKDIES